MSVGSIADAEQMRYYARRARERAGVKRPHGRPAEVNGDDLHAMAEMLEKGAEYAEAEDDDRAERLMTYRLAALAGFAQKEFVREGDKSGYERRAEAVEEQAHAMLKAERAPA